MSKTKTLIGVYKIENTLTGDFYIGSSENIHSRLWQHQNKLKLGKHKNIHLQRAYNKYGQSEFEYRILLQCEKSELLRYEQKLIDKLNPSYNICKIAGATRGKNISEKHKKAISSALKGIPRKQETKDKIKNSLLGIKHTAERNLNQGLARKGKPWTVARRMAQELRKVTT